MLISFPERVQLGQRDLPETVSGSVCPDAARAEATAMTRPPARA
jgi:hypothetical protein